MKKAMFAAVLAGVCSVACATSITPQAKMSDDAVVVVPKQAPIATVERQCPPLENGENPRGVKIRPALPSPDWKVAAADAPEFNGVKSDLSLLHTRTRARIMIDIFNADELDALLLNMRKAIASKGGRLGPIEVFAGECETVQAFLALAGKDSAVGNIVGLVRSKRHTRIGIFFIGFWPHQTRKGSLVIVNEIANIAAGLRLYR